MKIYSKEEKLCLLQDYISSFPCQKNLGEFSRRQNLGWIKPQDVEEIKRILAVCRLPGERLGIHVYSSGMNWGLGSFLPVEDSNVVLDLSAMNKMIQLNTTIGIAVIEPGVTQIQLSKALVGTPYMLNVTSSYSGSSILGNALDRGVGFHRQRDQDLVGAEVLLSNGEMVQVGSQWPLTADPAKAFSYQHGLGPNMMPLFFQSNFGVVTKGVIALLARPGQMHVMRIQFSWHHFDDVMRAFQKLYAEEILKSVLKIYNTAAVHMYRGEKEDKALHNFQGYFSIEGPTDICAAKLQYLRMVLRPIKIFLAEISADTSEVLDKVIYECFHGNPAHNDTMIHQSFKVKDCALDQRSAEGWISFLPIIPFEVKSLHKAYALIQHCVQGTSLYPMATINVISKTSIDLVVALRFKREPESIKEAHRVLDKLYESFAKEGFYPYRLDVDHMPFLRQHIHNKSYLKMLQNIKDILDPFNVWMSGRYIL